MLNLNIFNLNKNLTKSRNLIFSCLALILLSFNLLSAGWLNLSWFSSTSSAPEATVIANSTTIETGTKINAQILDLCAENPVKAGCAVGATAVAGIIALDCVAAHLVNRSADDRRAWGTIAMLGAAVGLGAWYKFTSDREAVLKDQINQNFIAIEQNSNMITVGITGVADSTTATGAALASASSTVTDNSAVLTAAQASAVENTQATAAAKTSVESLVTSFAELNQATQREILEKLQQSGLTIQEALARVNTNALSELLSALGISQTDLRKQCLELEKQAQETARQVELVKTKFARLAALEAQEQARVADATTDKHDRAASPTGE